MIKRFLKYHPLHKKLVPNLDIVFLLRPTFFFAVWVMVIVGMSSAQMYLADYPLWITEFSWMTFLAFLGLTFVCSSTFILNQISDEENDIVNKKLFLVGKYISTEKSQSIAKIMLISGLVISLVANWFTAILVGCIYLVWGIIYNQKPFNWKRKPILGWLANSVVGGLLFTIGWFLVMKSQLNKILIVTLVILFFTLSKSYSIEDVTEFTDAINEAREEFNNIPEASTEQSKIIDEALKEIDKATEYAQEAINRDNIEDAIKTLEFIEKTLTDVQSIIPQEFSSDMSKIDISVMSKEDMDIITEITTQMKTSKEKRQKDFMSDLIEINLKGIDTGTISENLNSLGVDTIKLDLVLDEKMETWTKEEWANSYKGSILTFDGTEVITDKEISSKVTELEGKFLNNTLKIESKRNQLSILNNQLNPINTELESLNEKKSLLTSQYNLEISKKFYNKDQKSIELSEKLKNELENNSLKKNWTCFFPPSVNCEPHSIKSNLL